MKSAAANVEVRDSTGRPAWHSLPRRALVALFPLTVLTMLPVTGVVPVLKHFPGHGDTSVDSHQVLPTAQDSDPERTTNLLPFRRAAAAADTAPHDHRP